MDPLIKDFLAEVLPLVLAAIVVSLRPVLVDFLRGVIAEFNDRTTGNQRRLLTELAYEAVHVAERLANGANGVEKRELAVKYVQEAFADAGFDAPSETRIVQAIEASLSFAKGVFIEAKE